MLGQQGRDRRDRSLMELTLHLKQVYIPCRRTWILLFPEGGFLHKRRDVSRQFALKNNLPTLNHVTIPRVGAVQNIVATISRNKKALNGNSNTTVTQGLQRPPRAKSRHPDHTKTGWLADDFNRLLS